jgi:signal transduction histidine kinase
MEDGHNSKELLRSASHNLRNILSAISGATRILGKGTDEATKEQMIGILKRSVADMERLIDQFNDLSQSMEENHKDTKGTKI